MESITSSFYMHALCILYSVNVHWYEHCIICQPESVKDLSHYIYVIVNMSFKHVLYVFNEVNWFNTWQYDAPASLVSVTWTLHKTRPLFGITQRCKVRSCENVINKSYGLFRIHLWNPSILLHPFSMNWGQWRFLFSRMVVTRLVKFVSYRIKHFAQGDTILTKR